MKTTFDNFIGVGSIARAESMPKSQSGLVIFSIAPGPAQRVITAGMLVTVAATDKALC
jgi:hypothetical protein